MSRESVSKICYKYISQLKATLTQSTFKNKNVNKLISLRRECV